MIDITGLREDKRPQSSTIVHALLDRLEAAESEALEQARLNGMGAEREAALLAKLEAAKKECDELRAKIKAMEGQKPVASIYIDGKGEREFDDWKCDLPTGRSLLYALPGAKGEEK